MINSFNVPDWLFYPASKSVALSNKDTTENFNMIEAGDVDESYDFGTVAKESRPEVISQGPVRLDDNGSFYLPVKLGNEAKVGAYSISMNYPPDKIEFQGIENGKDVLYHDNNGELKLAWMDQSGGKNPLKVNKGNELVTLKFKVKDTKNEITGVQINVEQGSEIVNSAGKILSDETLILPDTKKIIPASYNLSQNYPNPFNPSTNLRYSIPFNSHVRLTVYNILGQRVKVLVDQIQPAGYYKYQWDASDMASGVYICILNARSTDGQQNYQSIKKMVLLK